MLRSPHVAEDKIIYFDHAATTYPLEEVVSLYSDFAKRYFANPASAHRLGVENARYLAGARKDILNTFKCPNHEVIFTSGATEANNLALKGYMERYALRGKHLVVSSIEHPSVLNAANHLAKLGYEVSIVPCSTDGRISLEAIKREIREDTILVSVMAVNNETGIINDIESIASFIKDFPTISLHVDAVQAVGKIDLPYQDIDMVTISMHKLGGLKGSGILLKRKNIELSPLNDGGGHEFGYRSGTNDLAMIVADSQVVKNALKDVLEKRMQILSLVTPIYHMLESHKDELRINSSLDNPYIINISLLHKKASVFAEFLSNNNIMVSTHSACSSKMDIGSSTLRAMGRNEQESKNSLRFSFSTLNTKEEVERFIEVFEYGLKGIRG